jgi:hypothetical protein
MESLSTEPRRAHAEGRNADGLEDRALLILRPGAQLTPDRRHDTGEPRRSAKNAVDEADADIGGRAGRLDRLHRRTQQPIEAVKHQHDADARAQILVIGRGENGNADGHPDRRALFDEVAYGETK